MIIVNFKEYIETLRDLFAKRQKSEIDAYAQDILTSGQKQKKAKEKLQQEIFLITAKIKQLRQQIALTEDKAAISTQIKHLKKAKQDLIGKLKKRERTSRFSVLSAESKTALCTLTLLRKYLTKEILENEFLQMSKNAEGNIIFNRDWFERSSLFDDAVHVYDYVASYLQQNPEQVTSENYFNKLFDKESGWRGICRKADDFFEKLNKEKRKKSRAEIIAESRSDLELIKEYPAENLILVRLKTPEALDYEGSAAHNCVGGGSYDKLIGKRDSGIYSLRQIMPDGELKPVVTIEQNEGQIKQIRGVCNSFVAYDYSLPSRDAAMLLLNKNSQAGLVQDKNISESVLNVFGLFRDGKGGYLDIHNLTGTEDFELPELRITADGLKDYEWEKLKIKDVRILGKLQDSEACSYLEHLTNVQQITIDNLAVSLNLDLDKFNRLQKLNISSTDGAECCLHGQKSVLSELSLSKISLKYSENIRLKSLTCSIDKDCMLDVSDFYQLEKLTIKTQKDCVCSLTGQNKTLSCLEAEQLNLLNVAENSFPSVEILKCNSVVGEVFPLSAFPNLKKADLLSAGDKSFCLEGKHETLTELQIGGGIINNLSAPNLRKLECFLIQTQDLDISSFPKLENFFCASSQEMQLPLKGTAAKLVNLTLRKVWLKDIDTRHFPELKEVSFANTDLRRINLNLSADIQANCEDCVLNEKILHLHLSTPRRGNACNEVCGTHFDFSEYSEYLNLDGLHFHEAETMKFAPKIKTLQLDTQVPSSVKIEGLNEVENVILYLNPWNKLLMEKINPQTIKNLNFNTVPIQDSEFDISRYTNLKELSGSGFAIDEIPPSVEKLKMNNLFNAQTAKTDTWDFSCLPNLRDLNLHASASVKQIVFPQNMAKLKLGSFFWEIENLDFSHCHQLSEVKLAFIAPKIKKVSLPDCVEVLEASHGESGIGVRSDGFEKNTDLRIEIPSTAHPEIIGYLREQWGDDRISVISPQKKQIAPVLLLQNKNKRLK